MSRPGKYEHQQHIAKRRVARRLALIGVYQWLVTKHDFQELYPYFQQDSQLAADFRKCDPAFFSQLFRHSIEDNELATHIEPHLSRQLQHVDFIEHAVLRIATCELLRHPETPAKVIVNEAINLAKKFGSTDAHKFVNGVLDKVALQLRPAENTSDHPLSLP